MPSRYAWFVLSFAVALNAAPLVRAQPDASAKPAQRDASAPTPVAPAAPSATPSAPGTPLGAAAPAPPPAPTPTPAAAPGQRPTLSVLPPPIVVPPPTFVAPPPRRSYRFTAQPPRPKRRYGDAGAPFAIGLGANLRFRDDPGYDKLDAGKSQAEFDMFASYDVFQPVRRLVFAAGVSYRFLALGDVDTLQITNHAVQADVLARFTLARWLFPQLRAGIGAQLSRAALRDEMGDFRASDRDAGVTGSVGAGLTLQTPRRMFETWRGRLASLSIGFLIEGGYIFAAASSYQLKVKSDSELPNARIPLGKLEQGGAYLRLSGVLRF